MVIFAVLLLLRFDFGIAEVAFPHTVRQVR